VTKRTTTAAVGDASTKHSAVRALRLLEALNRRSSAYVRELAADTNFSKPTVVRLLQILVQSGYVLPVGEGGLYGPAARVVSLSSGFRAKNELVHAALPRMELFTAEHVWPLALGILERGAMVVQHSTTPASPLSWYRNTRGARLSLTNSAMGLAILAFLPQSTVAAVLDAASVDVEFARPEAELDDLPQTLEHVRASGYAARQPSPGHPTASISVPVLVHGQPMAGLSITVFGRATPPDVAARRFAPVLQQLATQIASDIEP
jgi:IclR family mhp operon transcriptional activator